MLTAVDINTIIEVFDRYADCNHLRTNFSNN
jgi:hypothetical protein